MTPTCPVIDHLACKIPGELEPRVYDVYAPISGLATGLTLPQQFVDLGNRDAPWHLAAIGYRVIEGTGRLSVKIYNSRGFAINQTLMRAGNLCGGENAAFPVNPSYVWPINSSLMFDVKNDGAGTGSFALFFFGFKIFDRGKAPC
jgi:hypothetical protein